MMTEESQSRPIRPPVPPGSPGGATETNPAAPPGGQAPGGMVDPRMAYAAGWVPCPPGMPMPPEEDEINLLDLFIVLLKHKWLIFWIVFLTGIGAVAYSLQMPNIYLSECTIAPTAQEKSGGGLAALGGFGAMIASEAGIGGTGSIDQFDVVLKSRELTNTVVQKHDLLPVIFEKSWDPKTKQWKVGESSLLQKAAAAMQEMLGAASAEKKEAAKHPTLQDAYKPLQEILKRTPDKKQNVMRLSVEHEDPKVAQAILNHFVVGLSEFLRRQTLEDAAAQQADLTKQLARTADPLLKNRLYELIAKQIEKETLAKVQKYYSFNVIDPPFVPERKFKPKRAQITLLSVVVAFFIAIFLAFFLEYVQNLKKREDPERLANLRNALRLRK